MSETSASKSTLAAALIHENAIARLRIANALRSTDTIALGCVGECLDALDAFVESKGVPEVLLLSATLAAAWTSLGVAVNQPRWDNAMCTVLQLPDASDTESLERWLRRTLHPTLVTARFKPLMARRAAGKAAESAGAVEKSIDRGSHPAPRAAAASADAQASTPDKAATSKKASSDIHAAVHSAVDRVTAVARIREARPGPERPSEATKRAIASDPVTSSPRDVATVSLAAIAARPKWRGAALVVVASSTGGPDALAILLAALPASLDAPVLLVQHMGERFTPSFAKRLNKICAAPVSMVEEGTIPVPGEIWLAPGNRHVEVKRIRGRLVLTLLNSPEVHGCRPAADVTLLSLVSAAPAEVLVVVLTGMGEDGAEGSQALRRTGCHVIVQDEASSVVWGMPGSVVKRDAADDVLPLQDIAGRIIEMTDPSSERVLRGKAVS